MTHSVMSQERWHAFFFSISFASISLVSLYDVHGGYARMLTRIALSFIPKYFITKEEKDRKEANISQKRMSTTESSTNNRSDESHSNSVRMTENILLIWLDSTIDQSTVDYRDTIDQLRNVVHTVNTFHDGDECIEFVERMSDEKICLIITLTGSMRNSLARITPITASPFIAARVWWMQISRKWTKLTVDSSPLIISYPPVRIMTSHSILPIVLRHIQIW